MQLLNNHTDRDNHREPPIHSHQNPETIHSHDKNNSKTEEPENWTPLAISASALLFGLIIEWIAGSWILSTILFLVSMLLAGHEIANVGVRSLMKRHVTIDLLVTIAAVGATLIGHIEEGASVVLLFNIAERLESWAGDRARHAIETLMKLRPELVTLSRAGEEIEVPVEEVEPGEIFILKPGNRVPLDGVVLDGTSRVDQSAITGESVPIEKQGGSEVYSGTLNIDGFLIVKTTRIEAESTLSRILGLIEDAEESKSPTEAFVDRFAKLYTPTVIGFAALIATIPPLIYGQPPLDWIYRALVLLVVACPCALAISTPVAMVAAITSASRHGVLVKGGAHIEALSKVQIVAFDKTGTLTEGKLQISAVDGGIEVLSCAAALESRSEHPIAYAIKTEAVNLGIKIPEASAFINLPGKGVQADVEGNRICVGNIRLMTETGIKPKPNGEGTVVYVSKDGELLGSLTLTDTIRAESANTIKAIQARGLRTEMLTGDNEATATRIAEEVGVDAYRSGLLPEEKVAAVKSMGGGVVMVGDGVNDAPALAAADVGIAMGAIGSDVALETADIALLEDSLDRIPYLIDLSRATMNTIRQNITVSLVVKFAVAALTVPGWVSLWAAVAFGDMGLTLLVVANSLRLGFIKPGKD
jgi:Cd2+/Zn2+-exporting ATPase